MIREKTTKCPDCGGKLKYYDTVKRVVLTKYRKRCELDIRRFKCTRCGRLHRGLPSCVLPYKQYEAEMIFGVREGLITSNVLGFEDYPCEMTMSRWRARKLQTL